MPSDIADLFARLRRAYDARDPVAISRLYADDCILESPIGGTVVGPRGVERVARLTFSSFPDFSYEHEDLLVAGSRIVQLLTVVGTDTGGFLGLPPTGRPFRAPSVFLFTIAHGKIARERRTYDFSGFLLQLAGGLVPEAAKLYRETLERAQMERDMKVAAEIQRALLPEARRVGAHFELVGASVPCRAIGGDFFDYFDLSGGSFGVALGDVSGKGAPAALLTAVIQGIFAAHAHASESPAETIGLVNQALLRRAVASRFATVFFAVLTPSGQLRYCNAGHNPPILVGRTGVRRLSTGGLILGAFSDAAFVDAAVQVEAGDVLVAYSDGLTEAAGPDGVEFGEERLLACIEEARTQPPSAVLEHIFETIRRFTGSTPQSDDMTAVVLRAA